MNILPVNSNLPNCSFLEQVNNFFTSLLSWRFEEKSFNSFLQSFPQHTYKVYKVSDERLKKKKNHAKVSTSKVELIDGHLVCSHCFQISTWSCNGFNCTLSWPAVGLIHSVTDIFPCSHSCWEAGTMVVVSWPARRTGDSRENCFPVLLLAWALKYWGCHNMLILQKPMTLSLGLRCVPQYCYEITMESGNRIAL